MKILVAGSSGLIGSALISHLRKGGHDVFRLVRSAAKENDAIKWNPYKSEIDVNALEGFDAVVNLAGESISDGRWNEEKKRRILESRVKTTSFLCQKLSELKSPPKVLVNASAVGYYGDQDDRWVTEDSPKGSGFLSDVCSQWESAAETAEKRGMRVVKLRFGVVLTPNGGALAKMLTPFKLGLGGVIGSGRQYISWIAIDDLTAVILYAIEMDGLKGPVNAVTPNPVTNYEWTKSLGKVLGRPTAFPLPAFIARLVFGEMADEMLLCSTRVKPERLQDAGYPYRYPELESALHHLLD